MKKRGKAAVAFAILLIIIVRARRELPNGRYDQIRYNNHENEGPHTHIKIMLSPDKIPTINGFQSKIHRLTIIVNGIRKIIEEDKC